MVTSNFSHTLEFRSFLFRTNRISLFQVIPESSLTTEEIKPESIDVEEEKEKEKSENSEKSQKSESGHVLVTASSSDHMIKLWRVLTDSESEVTLQKTEITYKRVLIGKEPKIT